MNAKIVFPLIQYSADVQNILNVGNKLLARLARAIYDSTDMTFISDPEGIERESKIGEANNHG